MAKKHVLVLFSGGIDSTYLVYKNLLEGNDVLCVHNKILNNTMQTAKEIKSIDNILEWLKNHFLYQKIRVSDFNVEFQINGYFDNISMLSQPFLWLSSLPIVLQCLPDIDEVQYGIIARDDALSYINDLKAIFNASMMTNNCIKYKGKLKFPLIKYQKSEIIDKLPTDLLRMTSSCEWNTENKYCNRCHSCRTLRDAFSGYDKDLNVNPCLNTPEEIEQYKKQSYGDELKEEKAN